MEYLIKILTGSLSPLLLTPDVSTSSGPASKCHALSLRGLRLAPVLLAICLLGEYQPALFHHRCDPLLIFSSVFLQQINVSFCMANCQPVPDKAGPPRCLLESLDWARPGGTGSRSGWRTRRMWGTSGSGGCPGICPRQRIHSGGTFYSQT